MSVAGFCGKCGFIRQDSDDGVPETPCVCMVEHHAENCKYRRAVSRLAGIQCKHGVVDVCPTCDACNCAAKDDILFRVKEG